MRRCVLVCFLLVVESWLHNVPVARGAEAFWPGLLGPARDGWVSGFESPSEWPEALTKLWQRDVGTGYGTPVVAEGRVYQHARQGDEEVVWCIDLRTADVIWRRGYPVAFKMGGGGERHGKGPKSCPMLANGKLFTMSITGVLSAWDARTGERLWYRDYSQRFKSGHPYWGASTSPIVDENRVVIHFGTDDEGVLVALDVTTGNEVWQQGHDGPSYSSPLLVEVDGVRQVIEWNHRALVGVDSRQGTLLWEYPFPHVGTNQNMPTPAFHQGCVLLGGENRGVHSIEPKLVNGKWVARARWHQEEVALDMSSAVTNGNMLFGLSHYGKGRLFCLDTETGKVLWQGPGRTGENVAFLSIPGHVMALISDGELRIVKAESAKYEMVASYRVADRPTWAPPVLLGKQLLIKDETTLTLWSLEE